MTVVLLVLAVILLAKCGSYLLRWYEVTGAEDFVAAGRYRQMARGVLPFLREYLATLPVALVWCVEMPVRLATRLRPGAGPCPADGGVPIVLVHGFSLTPGSMAYLWLRVRSLGRPVHLLDYHPMLGEIDGFARQLADLVDQVAGAGPVDVVGHSMGGLIAARYMADHPGRVRALVAIGTPFHGTRLWAMSVGRCLPQMRPGSAFLTDLAARPGFPGGSRVTCVYSDFDQVVLPYRSCHLDAPGVHNVALTGLGHAALLMSPRVAAETVAALRGGPEAPPEG